MTDHPAVVANCTKCQIEVFDQIGAGIAKPPASRKTFEALEKKGLIEAQRDVIGHDRFGPIINTFWYVPIPVHIQWCEWCSEQPEVIEEAKSDA